MGNIKIDTRYKRTLESLWQDKWEIKTLGEISGENIFFSNINVKQNCKKNGDIPFITLPDLLESHICISNCNLFTDSSCMKELTSARTNDLLILISDFNADNIAKSCAYLGSCECLVGQDLAVMRHSQNVKYLAYMMSTQSVKQQIKNLYRPSIRPRINLSDLKKIKIPLPSLSVQNEIVKILDKFVDLKNETKEEMERRNGKKKWKEEINNTNTIRK